MWGGNADVWVEFETWMGQSRSFHLPRCQPNVDQHLQGCAPNPTLGFKYLQRAAESAVSDLEQARIGGNDDIVSVSQVRSN